MPGYRYLEAKTIARLGRVQLVARGVVEGFLAGLHKSPHHGWSVEFSEHREYVPGDPPRHIDWRALARTGRYYVKLFEDETNVRTHLLVDTSASMGYASPGTRFTKLEYACYLAGAIAYLMIRQQDSVGLVTFDEARTSYLAPRSVASHLGAVLERLEALRAGRRTDLARTFHDVAEAIGRRGLIVIVSDLLDDEREVFRALRHFRRKRHEVILFHVLDPAETDFPFSRLADFVDLETGERLQVDPRYVRAEYRREVEKFCSAYRADCAESRVEYVRVNTAVPIETMLGTFLARRSRRGA